MTFLPKHLVPFFIITIAYLCHGTQAEAANISLINGDQITGTIISEGADVFKVEHDILGILTIKKNAIAAITGTEEQPAEETPAIVWKREIEAGYNITNGNTDTERFAGKVLINRNHVKVNETTFKGTWEETSTNDKLDSQKWYTLGRFAYSFGTTKQWYHFMKTELDHDKFANIDYRFVPASGLGYWFSDEKPFRAMAECALGYEYTNYSDSSKNSDDLVLIPRGFLSWDIFDRTTLSEDITVYPLLNNLGAYRLVSDLELATKLTQHFSAKLTLRNQYNSNPPADTKKHDLSLTSSLAYSF